jgi:hypothetical protein
MMVRRLLPWPAVAVYLALALLYNALIPLGEGPDEIGHLRYAVFLAEQQRLPTSADVPGEGHQPPLGYLPAAVLLALDPAPTDAGQLRTNPDFRWNGGSAINAFERGSLEAWPWQGLARDWHLARLGSTLWGLAALAAAWAAARRLRPADDGFAGWTLLIAATLPQWLFGSALVSNDSAAAALGAWLLYAVLPAAEQRRPLRWAIGSGALFGLALLTKLSLAIYAPLLLWAAWRRAGTLGSRLQLILLGGLSGSLTAGWWFFRNLQLSGDLLGLRAFQLEFAGQPFDWFSPIAWIGALHQLLTSSWAQFGWQTLAVPAELTVAAGLGALLAAAGLLQARRMVAPMLLAAVGLSLAWLLTFVATAGLVGWQGRLLWPALSAQWLLAAVGLSAVLDRLPPRSRPIAVGSGALLLIVTAAWLPVGVIAPAYPRSALDPAAAAAQLGTPIGVTLGDYGRPRVEVAGVGFPADAKPGETITVSVTWHSRAALQEPLQVFLHLATRRGRIIAEYNCELLGSGRPVTRWTIGDWYRNDYQLTVPARAGNGRYRLIIGLVNPQSGRRESVYSADGQLLDAQVDLGRLQVQR